MEETWKERVRTCLSLEAVPRKVKGKEKAGPNPAEQFLPPLPVEQHSAQHNTSDRQWPKKEAQFDREDATCTALPEAHPQSQIHSPGVGSLPSGFSLAYQRQPGNQSTREEGERKKRKEASVFAD